MLHRVVSVFDTKSKIFSKPMLFVTDGVALRSFSDEVNRKDSDLGAHVDDFQLFLLGTFDDQTGMYTQDKVEILALASSVKV